MLTCRVSLCAAIFAACSMFSAQNAAAQTPTPEAALKYRPAQSDVEIDTPTAAEVSKCVVKLERGEGISGFTVFDPDGQILRRYVDTNGDRFIDQWRYYRMGTEVYRDIDSNADNKIDQSRWVNTGGSRWGIDKNQDGKLDSWRVLSAEEATRVAVNAMIAGDSDLLSTVLISADDIKQLGIADEFAAALLRQVQNPEAALRAAMNTKSVTGESKWTRFDAAMPGVIPADDGKATEDLTVYEGAMAIIETRDQHGFVQIGEMIRVGNVWKLTQVPRPMTGNTIQVAMGGILMRPGIEGPPGGVDAGTELTPEMAAKIQELQKLDSNPPSQDATQQTVIAYLQKRRAIILQLINQSRTAQERETWQRQLINLLASMAQTGDRTGIAELSAIEADLRKRAPESSLVPYAIYRRLLGQYSLDLRITTDQKKQQELQETWLTSVEQFAKQFPQSEDAPDSLLQLAVNRELAGSDNGAREFYSQLASNYAETPQGKRAVGALRRLQLVGREMPLTGPDPSGRKVDASNYRGKLLLVVFWASWSGEFVDDVPVLLGLYNQYQSKGFEIVGVSLDTQADSVAPFIKQTKIPWSNIFEPGVFDSPLAQQYGILTAPTMFLIGRDGKVISTGISISDLKDGLRKQLD
ncbi:MAG: redoxin domain-containing protein [Planctomycetota bacterium]|nr:redoxin domain-containing protein [Planctomycetota bacterium]MDA1251687.1 redoxin domain-containing protein [Planctomycetota bacterium]